MSENNKPVYRLRYGNVVACVWANSTTEGYFAVPPAWTSLDIPIYR